MTASIGREVKATFSFIFNALLPIALEQTNEAQRQQLV